MSGKIPRDQRDLEEELQTQLRLLQRACDSFDDGLTDEARNIALRVRVLVHDTGSSHSLLGQLGMKEKEFYDTSVKTDPRNILPEAALAGFLFGFPGPHVAPLDHDNPNNCRWVKFDEWWGTVIFKFAKCQFTRKDLIIILANQEGGAHVDPEINQDFANLAQNNALGRYHGPLGAGTVIEGAEVASVRQIGHEILKTLKPGYAKKPTKGPIIVAPECIPPPFVPAPSTPAPSVEIKETTLAPVVETETVATLPHVQKRVGRNDPCPCGSGKKYKRCHGKYKNPTP